MDTIRCVQNARFCTHVLYQWLIVIETTWSLTAYDTSIIDVVVFVLLTR